MTVEGCLGCDLTAGRHALPGGVIHEADGWVVEHCLGPLGVGTLIMKPRRHVTRVADLMGGEAIALGPLLLSATQVVTELTDPEQTYVTLWSHAGGEPVHIHFVIQPITAELMEGRDAYGPMLQVAMFEAGVLPPVAEVEAFADRARPLFA